MTLCSPNTLIEKLIATAHTLRLGHEAEGAQRLRECLNHLEPMLAFLPHSSQILALIPSMLAAQDRHDWLGLADYLEHELPALLTV